MIINNNSKYLSKPKRMFNKKIECHSKLFKNKLNTSGVQKLMKKYLKKISYKIQNRKKIK